MGTADTATRHTTGPITVHPFNNTITRGFELRVTSEGVPDCPIGIAALKADADLWANAGRVADELRALLALVAPLAAPGSVLTDEARALLRSHVTDCTTALAKARGAAA